MKVYIVSIPAGSSQTQPRMTLIDPPYIPRVGELINILHDPIIHKVESVCFNFGEETSITVGLEDDQNINSDPIRPYSHN